MRIGSIVFWLAAASASAAAASCRMAGPGSTPVREIHASVEGLGSLLEGECFEWRSFDWARNQYMRDRAACVGEIARRSIEDCHANVTSADWIVKATNASAAFEMSYFFDEVSEPNLDDASCHIKVPPELAREGYAAARKVAARHRLKGPFRSGEHGFSTPTLREYWVDQRNSPTLGVFNGRSGTDPTGIQLIRYPRTMTANHSDDSG